MVTQDESESEGQCEGHSNDDIVKSVLRVCMCVWVCGGPEGTPVNWESNTHFLLCVDVNRYKHIQVFLKSGLLQHLALKLTDTTQAWTRLENWRQMAPKGLKLTP